MLTFLSRLNRRLIKRAPTAAAASHLPAPQLRLVRGEEPHDIRVAAARPFASAFVAGQGARIYSLEVFRRRRSGPPTPRAA